MVAEQDSGFPGCHTCTLVVHSKKMFHKFKINSLKGKKYIYKKKKSSDLQLWGGSPPPSGSVSSEVLVHAEAAPPAAALRGPTGQQGVGPRASPGLLHQDVPQAVEPRQAHVGHQVAREDGGAPLRLVQLHEAQGVQAQGRSHQGRGGRGGGAGGERLVQRLGLAGAGGRSSGGGVAPSLELQLL